MKRIICLVIVLLMIMPALISCDDVDDNLVTVPAKTTKTSISTPDGPSVLDPKSDVYDEGLINEYNSKYTEKQKVFLTMLNYYMVNAQRLTTQKNNRLFLESLYSELYNQINPDKVDNRTKSKILSMLDNLEKLRMITVKRDRIQFLYEKAQAQAIRDAIPDPSQMLNVVLSGNWVKMAASVALMAVDSVSKYQSSSDEADLQLIKDGWELDDAQSEAIHKSVTDVVDYRISQVNSYGLVGEDTITIENIEKLAKNLNDSNVNRRIDFLEKNKNTYKYYGGYWLALSDCYYEKGDYRRCLDAVLMFEQICPKILRKDHDYAAALVKVLDILSEKDNDLYLSYAPGFCQKILDNITEDDWAMRYFVAITYIDLYNQKGDSSYLKKAFNELQTNVRVLSKEQQTLNSEYLSDFVEKTIPMDATKDEQTKIKNYNKAKKEERKTELPSVNEPFYTNLAMIDAVADTLGMGSSERKREILNLIVDNDGIIFLNAILDSYYQEQFGGESPYDVYLENPVAIDSSVSDKKLSEYCSSLGMDELAGYESNIEYYALYLGEPLPLIILSDGTILFRSYMVTNECEIGVYLPNNQRVDTLKIESVDRKTNGDFVSFVAKFSSSKIKNALNSYGTATVLTIKVTPYTKDNISRSYKYQYTLKDSLSWFSTAYVFAPVE